MKKYRIAVLPGDGIGPDVVAEGLKVLEALADIDPDFRFETEVFEWNSEYYLENSRMMPEGGLNLLKTYDAIYFGAIGDRRVPEHIPIWELIMPIRKQFRQYVNVRPIKQLKGIRTPLATKKLIDFHVFRENAEGEYSNIGGHLYSQTNDEIAVQNSVFTRNGIERLASFAMNYAKENKVDKVVNATKSNAIIHSMKLWDDVVDKVGSRYPDIEIEHVYIDALAAYFVQRPESFKVIIASNLFGDILTDLGAALVGGLGLSPSANLNPEREYPSMFEPIHGSAPDIAGKNIANPIAQIWSAAMMLEHLGRPDLASKIINGIEGVLEAGEVLTPDLGGTAHTDELGDAIVDEIRKGEKADGIS